VTFSAKDYAVRQFQNTPFPSQISMGEVMLIDGDQLKPVRRTKAGKNFRKRVER